MVLEHTKHTCTLAIFFHVVGIHVGPSTLMHAQIKIKNREPEVVPLDSLLKCFPAVMIFSDALILTFFPMQCLCQSYQLL